MLLVNATTSKPVERSISPSKSATCLASITPTTASRSTLIESKHVHCDEQRVSYAPSECPLNPSKDAESVSMTSKSATSTTTTASKSTRVASKHAYSGRRVSWGRNAPRRSRSTNATNRSLAAFRHAQEAALGLDEALNIHGLRALR